MNPYEVLGISPRATRAQIVEAYRSLVQIYHPDLYHNSPQPVRAEAEQRMKELNQAYKLAKARTPATPDGGPPRPSGIANIRSAALWVGTAPGSWARTARRAGTPGPDLRPDTAEARARVARVAREHSLNTRVARERREEQDRAVPRGEARARPKSRTNGRRMAGLGRALSTGELKCTRCRSVQRLPSGWQQRLDDTDFYCSVCQQVILSR